MFETSHWGSVAPWEGLGTYIIILGVLFRPRVRIFCPHCISAAKMVQNHSKRGPTALRRAPAGSPVPVHGQNPLRQRLGCPFCRGLTNFRPQMVSVGPIWACLGPACVPRSETKKMTGLDRPNRDSEKTFLPCEPSLLVVSTLVLSCLVCLVFHIHLCARVPAL